MPLMTVQDEHILHYKVAHDVSKHGITYSNRVLPSVRTDLE